MDSNNPDGVFAGMGIPPMEYGKIITMIYLKASNSISDHDFENSKEVLMDIHYLKNVTTFQVSISDFLTFFSGRTQVLAPY